MKRIITVLLLCIVFGFLLSTYSYATENKTSSSDDEMYEELENSTDADALSDTLPDYANDLIKETGIDASNYKSALTVNPKSFFSAIYESAKGFMGEPISSMGKILAVIFLCALFSCFEKDSGGLSSNADLAGTLCAALLITVPISKCITQTATALKAASVFIFSSVPVFAGIMGGSGQPITASSYSFLSLLAGNAVSAVSVFILEPLLNIFLCFSVVSSLSDSVSLSGFCESLSKAIKIVLAISLSIFTALISVQSAISYKADASALRAAKVAASAFVPVVGSAVSDAMSAVYGSLGILRSGVGAFGIIASAAIFLPSIIMCCIWMIFCYLGESASSAFSQKGISKMLKSAAKTLELMMAFLISSSVVLIVSCAVVLSGGGSA